MSREWTSLSASQIESSVEFPEYVFPDTECKTIFKQKNIHPSFRGVLFFWLDTSLKLR